MSSESQEAATGNGGEPRAVRWLWLAVVAVWLALSVPILFGESTLYERDVMGTHLPQKSFGAEQLAQGRIPYFRPEASLGQPFRSNPNFLPLYPGNLLYLVLPFWTAFNLHFAAHWLLALFSMRWLARVTGHSEAASLFAALTYAGCGLVVSSISFYNLLVVAAWWPLALGGTIRGGPKGIAIGGLSVALGIYGGEPVSAAVGLVLLVVLALTEHGLRRGAGVVAGIGLLSALLAMPQLVSALRGLEFSTRATFRGGGEGDAMHVLRLLELVVPLPFGVPASLGADRFLLGRISPVTPFFHSIHFGLAAVPLALFAMRRRPTLSVLATVGLVAAFLSAPILWLSFGLLRFPEKSLFLIALALPLLAATGYDRWRPTPRVVRAVVIVAVVLAVAAPIAWVYSVPWTRFLATDLPPVQIEPVGLERGRSVALGLLVSSGLLFATAWALHTNRRVALLLVQLVAVLRLLPIVELEQRAPYEQTPEWRALLPDDVALVRSTNEKLLGNPFPAYQAEPLTSRVVMRAAHADLGRFTGRRFGVSHPVVMDVDGSTSPRMAMVTQGLVQLDPPTKVRLLRVLGADAVVFAFPEPLPGLREIARSLRFGWPTLLLEVPAPAPKAWWPNAVVVADSQQDAFASVLQVGDPVLEVTVEDAPASLERTQAAGSVRIVTDEPDRLVLEVESTGGVVAVRRSFHPLWRARVGADAGTVLPLNVTLIGVEVPAGRHRVVLDVDRRPDQIAWALTALGTVLFLVLFFRHRLPSGRTEATPDA